MNITLQTVTVGSYLSARVGDFGVAEAGYLGTAIAGDFGTAIAGYCGTARAGNKGTLILSFFSYGHPRRAVGHIGETLDATGAPLKPNTAYKLDEAGEFILA